MKNIGTKGDVKEVGFGYAYNFLIPKGFAVEEKSTEGKKHINYKSKISSQKEEKAAYQRKGFESIPEKIFLQVPVSEKGTLFSKITPQFISDHLKGEGIDAPKDWFLFTPIDKTGDHLVGVEYQGESKEVTLSITKEDE